MNRRERRRKLLEKNKAPTSKTLQEKTAEWLETLSVEECMYIDMYAKDFERADLMEMSAAFKRVFDSILHDYLIDDTLPEMTDVLEMRMIEEGNAIKGAKMGGQYYMAKIDKLKQQIISLYEELKEKGNYKNEKAIVQDIVAEFPTLTPTSIKSVITEHKRVLKRLNAMGVETVVEDTTIAEPQKNLSEDVVVSCSSISDEKEAEEKKQIEVVVENITEKINEVIAEDTTAETKEEPKKSKFRVIKEVVKYDVQGEFGVYHIENKTLNVGDAYNEETGIKSKDEIKEWADKQRQELLNKIALLDATEKEFIEIFEEFIND